MYNYKLMMDYLYLVMEVTMNQDICSRIEAPEALNVPNTVIDKWQNTIDTMAKLIDVPTGLIMRLNKEDIEVFVSSKTEGNPYKVGDHEHFCDSGLYCETVIRTNDMLLVPNALTDEHWCNNPDVKLDMISYLGFPLTFPSGEPFGTICVLDNKENSYNDTFIELIKNFLIIIKSDIELLHYNQLLGEENRLLSDYIDEIKELRDIVPICSCCKKVRDESGFWQNVEQYLEKHSGVECSHGICDECAEKLYGKDTVKRIKERIEAHKDKCHS